MARTTLQTKTRDSQARPGHDGRATTNHADTARRHEHRTAKIVELIGTSTKSFEDAVRGAIKDASATTRGITGAQVEGFSVKCVDGKITEYKASLKVVFGIERT
jgi:dodecin